jgi:hypothetical protein
VKEKKKHIHFHFMAANDDNFLNDIDFNYNQNQNQNPSPLNMSQNQNDDYDSDNEDEIKDVILQDKTCKGPLTHYRDENGVCRSTNYHKEKMAFNRRVQTLINKGQLLFDDPKRTATEYEKNPQNKKRAYDRTKVLVLARRENMPLETRLITHDVNTNIQWFGVSNTNPQELLEQFYQEMPELKDSSRFITNALENPVIKRGRKPLDAKNELPLVADNSYTRRIPDINNETKIHKTHKRYQYDPQRNKKRTQAHLDREKELKLGQGDENKNRHRTHIRARPPPAAADPNSVFGQRRGRPRRNNNVNQNVNINQNVNVNQVNQNANNGKPTHIVEFILMNINGILLPNQDVYGGVFPQDQIELLVNQFLPISLIHSLYQFINIDPNISIVVFYDSSTYQNQYDNQQPSSLLKGNDLVSAIINYGCDKYNSLVRYARDKIDANLLSNSVIGFDLQQRIIGQLLPSSEPVQDWFDITNPMFQYRLDIDHILVFDFQNELQPSACLLGIPPHHILNLTNHINDTQDAINRAKQKFWKVTKPTAPSLIKLPPSVKWRKPKLRLNFIALDSDFLDVKMINEQQPEIYEWLLLMMYNWKGHIIWIVPTNDSIERLKSSLIRGMQQYLSNMYQNQLSSCDINEIISYARYKRMSFFYENEKWWESTNFLIMYITTSPIKTQQANQLNMNQQYNYMVIEWPDNIDDFQDVWDYVINEQFNQEASPSASY